MCEMAFEKFDHRETFPPFHGTQYWNQGGMFMRDYQPTTGGYALPKTLYKRLLAVVRDYDRQKARCRRLESGSREKEEAARELEAVEKALNVVPEELRQAVFGKIKDDVWPIDVPAGKNLPAYWKSRYLYRVAEELKLL